MKKIINQLSNRYDSDLKELLDELCSKNSSISKKIEDLSGTIFELFHLSDTEEYHKYIEAINEFEKYNAPLSLELEESIHDELNVMLLLGFHLALRKKDFFLNEQ